MNKFTLSNAFMTILSPVKAAPNNQVTAIPNLELATILSKLTLYKLATPSNIVIVVTSSNRIFCNENNESNDKSPDNTENINKIPDKAPVVNKIAALYLYTIPVANCHTEVAPATALSTVDFLNKAAILAYTALVYLVTKVTAFFQPLFKETKKY